MVWLLIDLKKTNHWIGAWNFAAIWKIIATICVAKRF